MSRREDERQQMPGDVLDQYERASRIYNDRKSTAAEFVETSRILVEASGDCLEGCCRHALCSRTLELALQYLYESKSYYPLQTTLQSLSPCVKEMACHPNGSHVV